MFLTVKEKLERIQVADEDQFFECMQKILRGIDQQELKDVFQAWVQRIQEVSQGKAMETTSDDKSFSCILFMFNFIRWGWACIYRPDDMSQNCLDGFFVRLINKS
jgi:hypothetical protein